MSDLTNPALRLFNIFSAAKKQNTIFQRGWANVFGIKHSAREDEFLPIEVEIEITEHLLQLSRLIDDTEALILELEGAEEAVDYISPLPRLRHCLRTIHVTSSLSEVTNSITASDLTVLRFASKLLARHISEPRLDDELKEIRMEIDDLYLQIVTSELPLELKSLLLDLAHALRSAVHEYNVRGANRLREGIEDVVGKLVVNKDVLEKVGNTEEGGRFTRLFWKTVALTEYAPRVWKVIETVAPAAKLLLGAPPSVDDVPPPPME